MKGIAQLALIAVAAIAHAAAAQDCRNIAAPPLRPIGVEQPKRIQLDNGMVILLAEDHELPLVYAAARMRGGRLKVPAGKAGLSTVYYKAWRTGGTASKTGDQLDEILEGRGAMLETYCADPNCSVTFDTLKEDLDTVFPLFVDLLRHPAFRQDKIDLAKTYEKSAIARRNDYAGDIASREAWLLGFGPESPMARLSEYATIASITRDDLVAFHDRFVVPNNMIVAVAGDFDSASMERRLRDAFGSWPRGTPVAAPAIPVHRAKPGVYFVEKDDVTQSAVLLISGQGTLFSDPDFAAVQVLNQIISGGFSGRLMNDIRSKRGLAYSVGGGVGLGFEPPLWLTSVSLGTKSETTVEGITATRDVLASLRSEPPTAEEIEAAKETILNRYVFTMDTKRKILDQRLNLEFYGYPADFWQKYPAAIRAVTAADVTRVAKKYFRPDQLITIVVGKSSDFDRPLGTLGPVTTVDVTIPGKP
ncbi:MAG TPA: pitrilysin family protein [Thermoanaerobaculia bacterium]|nr:pitrilysin family protein [Thermoanaerobaculia bacterium]